MIRRASLSKGKTVNLEDTSAPTADLKASGSEIVTIETTDVAQQTTYWTKLLAAFLAVVAVLIGLIYVGLSATLMTSVSSDEGRLWLTRGTFPGGVAPRGVLVYASSTTPAPSNAWERVVEGFSGVPDAVVGDVVAGPYDNVSTVDGYVAINGRPTEYKGDVTSGLLNNQYIISGLDGKISVVPARNISGEVQGKITLGGLERL